MRILHVIPQFPYRGGRTIIGGHASCLMTLALAQARAGAQVTILSYVDGLAADAGGEVALADGVRVVSLFGRARPGLVSYGLRFGRRAVAWARARRHEFDLVHGHSGFADYLVVSRAIQRATRLPTAHTMYCPIPSSGGRWRLPVVRGVLRRSATRLDALCAMSTNVAESMSAYGAGETSVIPPPVDLDRFHPAGDVSATRATLGLADDEVALLFVGNAKPQKNLVGTLRAFHDVHGRHGATRLVVTTELAQSASDDALAALRRELLSLDLEPAVIQKGIVDDMPALMQACDVLVAPFLDSFGPSDYFMAVLEAMACGKPVIVSAVGGMPEVVSDSSGRLVDPLERVQIAGAMEEFVTDAERRRSAGASARKYAEAHFDPRDVAERYEALYSRIAA